MVNKWNTIAGINHKAVMTSVCSRFQERFSFAPVHSHYEECERLGWAWVFLTSRDGFPDQPLSNNLNADSACKIYGDFSRSHHTP